MEESTLDGWNHNRHYHKLILDHCRPPMHTALDVGCGESLLAQALNARGLIVKAIDACNDVLAIARRREHGIRWVHGDVMIHDFGEQQFDLVTAVATVHHLPDCEGVLDRLRSLVSPGRQVGNPRFSQECDPSRLCLRCCWSSSAPVLYNAPWSRRRFSSQKA